MPITQILMIKILEVIQQVWLQCQLLKWSGRLITTKIQSILQVWLQWWSIEWYWTFFAMKIIWPILKNNHDDDSTSVHLDDAWENTQVWLQQCFATMFANTTMLWWLTNTECKLGNVIASEEYRSQERLRQIWWITTARITQKGVNYKGTCGQLPAKSQVNLW